MGHLRFAFCPSPASHFQRTDMCSVRPVCRLLSLCPKQKTPVGSHGATGARKDGESCVSLVECAYRPPILRNLKGSAREENETALESPASLHPPRPKNRLGPRIPGSENSGVSGCIGTWVGQVCDLMANCRGAACDPTGGRMTLLDQPFFFLRRLGLPIWARLASPLQHHIGMR